MAYDGEVKVKTSIDNSGLQKDAKQSQGIIDGFAKKLSSSKMSNIGASISGIAVAVKAVGTAAKTVSATVKDLTDTYKTQAKAETQLETAARNNPYLDESSVRQLKKYAGELQGIGTVGDEQLLPMMAQLAAAGRTQSEIQKIMAAALDVSASGAMSMESAVRNLNKTFSGLSGELGESIPQIKSLTAEELKQGKAVEVVAKQYRGMAKETAAATGTAEQLANTWGDFKEMLGEGLEQKIAPIRRAFNELLSDVITTHNKMKEIADANESISGGSATVADWDVKIEEMNEKIRASTEYLNELKAAMSGDWDNAPSVMPGDLETQYRFVTKEIQNARDALVVYQKEKGKINLATQEQSRLEKSAADEAERNAAAQKAIEDAKKRANDLATNALDAYKKSVDGVEREIAAREQLGEYVSEHEKAQMRYEARYNGYIGLLTSAQGAISGKLEREKETREEILKLAKELADYEDSPEAKADKFAEAGKERKANAEVEIDWKTNKESLVKARTEIENLQELLVNNESVSAEQRIALEEKYKEAIAEINAQIEEGDKKFNEQRVQQAIETMGKIKSYTDETVAIMQNAANLMSQAVQNQCDAELAELEKKYLQGEMSEEEYNEKVTEAKEKAAKEQYKIQMFQWSASILQATANIAQGVTQAIAEGGVAGLITGGIVAAAGAVQIASIIASKPTSPSFATGGIVQGNSYSGDKIQANVNSGEMILNATQQRSLWEAANGRGAGGGVSIQINNSAANLVSAKPQITEEKIGIMIDARVNEGLKSGKYDQSLTMANQGMNGETWGI